MGIGVQGQAYELNVLAFLAPVEGIARIRAGSRDEDDFASGEVGFDEADGPGDARRV